MPPKKNLLSLDTFTRPPIEKSEDLKLRLCLPSRLSRVRIPSPAPPSKAQCNALLARLYTHAYLVTGAQSYARVARGIIDYVLREMTSDNGGFYSAQDADSEGVEGKFFVWRPEELTRILGSHDAEIVADYYGVNAAGNFEGRTILTVPNEPAVVAAHHSMSVHDLHLLVESSNAKLLAVRSERVPPMTDTKVIVSWNGLMLAALAEAGAVFDRDDYLDAARANADFLLDRMMDDGRLRRTDSRSPNGALGFLDDHAALIDGLLALHRADGGGRGSSRHMPSPRERLTSSGTPSASSSLTPAATRRS